MGSLRQELSYRRSAHVQVEGGKLSKATGR